MTENKIDIRNLVKADVLAVLYNSSKPQGMGFLNYDPTPMTREQAQELIDSGHTSFDYLEGRVMKVDISGDEFSSWAYDRDNGEGAAEQAISTLRSIGETDSDEIRKTHHYRTQDAARKTKGILHKRTHSKGNVIYLGIEEHVAETLNKSIDEGLKKLNKPEQQS